MKYFLVSSRPKQWTKNILVFAAPLLAFEFNFDTLLFCLIAFMSFCLVSSGIYFLNDALDVKKDRLHPIKKNRPIASGIISKKRAILCSILLIFSGFLLTLTFIHELFLILSTYCLIQIFYCLYLKDKPLVDIFCISSGFLLRALAGGVKDNVYLSPWFILTVGLLALFLAIEKRKAELRYILNGGMITRIVLSEYSLPLLHRLENVVATSSFISYSLWAAGPELNGAKSSWMLITIPFVLYGIFRYQLISDPDESSGNILVRNSLIDAERPEEILLNDRPTQINLLAWSLTCILVFSISN